MKAILTALALLLAAAAPGEPQDFSSATARTEGSVGRVLSFFSTEYGPARSDGSGFVVGYDADDALIFVTNNHVVEGGETILVGFSRPEGPALFEASVIRRSSELDLALLALQHAEGPEYRPEPVPLVRRDILKAEAVAAIGFPGFADDLIDERNPAFFESTVSQGTVSKVFNSNPDAGWVVKIVQHTAAINPGNSGGPLIDRCGGVVAVNTAFPLTPEGGSPPQGTFWASSADELANYLDRMSLPYSTMDADCAVHASAQRPSGAERALGRGGNAPDASRIPGWALGALTLIGAGVAATLGAIALKGRAPAAVAVPAAGGEGAAVAPAGAAPAPGGLELRIAGLNGGPARFPLAAAKLRSGVTIGRNPRADINLEDGRLSREHARLCLRDRRLTITDLGSTNGTRIDGRRLNPNETVQINSASRIEIGGLRLSVRRADGPRPGEQPG